MEQKTKAEQAQIAKRRRYISEMQQFVKQHAPIGRQLAVTIFAGAKRIPEATAMAIYNEAFRQS